MKSIVESGLGPIPERFDCPRCGGKMFLQQIETLTFKCLACGHEVGREVRP